MDMDMDIDPTGRRVHRTRDSEVDRTTTRHETVSRQR